MKGLLRAMITVMIGVSLLQEVSGLVQWQMPTQENIETINTHKVHKQTYKEYVQERLEIEEMMNG